MPTIDAKTTVPLAWVIAFFSSILIFGVWIGTEATRTRIAVESAWTLSDMERWSAEAVALNPAAKFPDPLTIVQRRKSVQTKN